MGMADAKANRATMAMMMKERIFGVVNERMSGWWCRCSVRSKWVAVKAEWA